MKYLLLIPVLGLTLCASACRTSMPLDPNTLEPSTRCLPENYPHRVHYGTIHATK